MGLTLTLCSLLACAGTAQACGGDLRGPVVEHGRSAGGQVWSQIACAVGRGHLDVEVSFPGPGGTDAGGGMLVPVPSSRRSLFVDAPGVGLGRRRSEDVLDGVAFRDVVGLRLVFRTGPPRMARTVRAPASERRRFRYVRGLRFFVYFFADSRGLPWRVCGIDARGSQTGCRPVTG